MGTCFSLPRRRRDDSPLSYFGIPVNTLTVYEQRVVLQSANYIPGVPVLLQDVAFFWDSQSQGDVAAGTTAAVSPDSMWVASVEETINSFVKKRKLLSLGRNTLVGKAKVGAKRKFRGKSTARVFEKPFHTFIAKMQLRAPHFVALLTLFLRKLPEPLLPALFVRRMEGVLSNSQLSKEEKAEAVEKLNRHSFMSTHPQEHTVYQYLKQLVQRHRTELIAAEVEVLVRAMVRETTERVVKFILQQVRPVSAPILSSPWQDETTASRDEVNKPSGAVLKSPSGDDDGGGGCGGANHSEEVLYSPTGSSHSAVTGKEDNFQSDTSVKSLHSARVQDTSCEKKEMDQEKEEMVPSDEKAHVEEGEPRPMPAMSSVESSELRETGNEDSSSPLPSVPSSDAPNENKVKPKQEVNFATGPSEAVFPHRQSDVSSSREPEEETKEDVHSTSSNTIENKQLNEAVIVDSVKGLDAPSPRTTKKNSQQQEKGKLSGVASKNVVPADSGSCSGGSDAEKECAIPDAPIVDPCVVSTSGANMLQRKESFPRKTLRSSSSTVHLPPHIHSRVTSPPDSGKEGKGNQETPPSYVRSSGLEKQMMSREVLVLSLPTKPPDSEEEMLNSASSRGKKLHDDPPKFLAKQHPRYAALMGAKQLFLGKGNFPAKQVSLKEPPPSPGAMESADVKTDACDCLPHSRVQASSAGPDSVGSETRGGASPRTGNTDQLSQQVVRDSSCVEEKDVYSRVIYPLVARLDEFSARCGALEGALRTTKMQISSIQATQSVKQLESEVALLKDALRKVVESHLETVDNILTVKKEFEQQTKELTCKTTDMQGWREDVVCAREAAVEAQRRCANLEKAEVQVHQQCQYISLKMKDFASKLEDGEKEKLNLKIEVSALQRQVAMLRERLLS